MSPASGPLVVGVTDLLRAPGLQRDIRTEATFDELTVARSSVPSEATVVIDLVMESTLGEAVTVHGTVTAPWRGECRRCLEPIEGTLETDIAELFERRPSDEESYPIVDEAIDLEPVARDALVLALPLSPLCRPDCPGPSPDVYPVSVEDDDAGAPPVDERWAVLGDLRFDDAGQDGPGDVSGGGEPTANG